MQCPNCGKEAINVNGRYVCLDCGIELSSNGSPVAPAMPTATVDNHGTPTLTEAIGEPTPVVPSEPAAPQIITTPSTLSASANPALPDQIQPEPVSNPTPAEPLATGGAAPMTEAAPLAVEPQPEPVRDYFMNALGQDDPTAPATDGAEKTVGSVLPDFPIPEESAAVAPAVIPDTPAPVIAPVAPVEVNPNAPTTDAPPPPVEAENFFQPSSLNINPGVEPATPVAEIPLSPTPVEPESPVLNQSAETDLASPSPLDSATEAPIIAEPTPIVAPSVNNDSEPTSTEPEVPLSNNPAEPILEVPTPALAVDAPVVDPLELVESTPVVDGVAQPEFEVAPSPVATNTQNPSNFPGTGTIPSAESVFGGGVNPPTELPAQKKNWKKWLWIGLVILGILILLGGGVYAYMSFFSSASSEQGATQDQGQTLAISQNVAGEMDATTDVGSDFTQTLDFSKATPQDASLSSFFSTPNTLKETWAVNSTSDIALDSTQGTISGKRIYIKSEDATYVYSNDTKTWVKATGSQLSPSSIFFPMDPRGYLFYLGRVEEFTDQGSETIDGVEAKKIKIVIKEDVAKELLTAANPAFAKIKYEEANVDGLEVIAWVNGDNRILKVTVSGTIEVTSDIYSGSVGVTAAGSYKYATQTVKKP